MKMIRRSCAFALAAVLAGSASAAPQSAHGGHADSGHPGAGMGFDVARTVHHFRLTPRGGIIDVRVKDPDDRGVRNQVAAHLKMTAVQFARGDFSGPFAVHGEDPAGVPVMKRLAAEISYRFVPARTGGQIVISTGSATALSAVHEFLRYQIRAHHTGDPLKAVDR
jgi:hypothetical protein